MPDKVALVTGAGKRMGRAIASRLAREGYAVAIHYLRSGGDAADLAGEIVAAGGRATAFPADLADPAAISALIPAAARAMGPISLLVNSAGLFESDTLDTLDLDRWRRHFAVNVEAPVLLAEAFARLLPADTQGAIVNIVDHRVLRLTPQHFSYTLSKATLWTATQTMAQALAPRIRVNAVGPGPTYPNPVDGDAGLAREAAGVPLRRRVEGEDIADAVAYLASAASVTGQLIAVDAGQHIGWRTPDIVD